MTQFEDLPEIQQEFLRLHVINQVGIQKVADDLGVSKQTLSGWYDKELKTIRQDIAKIRTLFLRKECSFNFFDFYNWYKNQERECIYCGINEEQIKKLIESKKLFSKRLVTRGKSLELDRKNAKDTTYNDLENLVLSCYWCNNAKTDTFTFEEFKEVGKSFREIWKERLGK